MCSMANSEGSAVKVIGFKVNGTAAENETSQPTAYAASHTGSPLPVTIPPSFKTPREHTTEQPSFTLCTKEGVADTNSASPRSGLTRQIHPMADKNTELKSKPVSKSKETGSASGGSSKRQSSQKKPQQSTKGKKEGIRRETKTAQCISLFDHLETFEPFNREAILRREEVTSLDPVFIRFCLEYGSGQLSESKACKEMLEAFDQSLHFFQNEMSLFYTREVLAFLNHRIGFLVRCRRLNVAMRNAIRILKVEVTKLKSGVGLDDGKEAMRRLLKGFVEERVDVSHIIAKEAESLIENDDVVLTYAYSETVLSVITHARQQGKRCRVVVVDALPDRDGKTTLGKLAETGIECSYVLINALGFALKGVTKVVLGASAVMSNGTVVSRAGSASVAMMARSLNIPIVICSQTLKFHGRFQLDAFTQNELGDTRAMIPGTASMEDRSHLNLLNLKYDLMPSTFVSAIVSELGSTPSHSVSVILREQACEKDSASI